MFSALIKYDFPTYFFWMPSLHNKKHISKALVQVAIYASQ